MPSKKVTKQPIKTPQERRGQGGSATPRSIDFDVIFTCSGPKDNQHEPKEIRVKVDKWQTLPGEDAFTDHSMGHVCPLVTCTRHNVGQSYWVCRVCPDVEATGVRWKVHVRSGQGHGVDAHHKTLHHKFFAKAEQVIQALKAKQGVLPHEGLQKCKEEYKDLHSQMARKYPLNSGERAALEVEQRHQQVVAHLEGRGVDSATSPSASQPAAGDVDLVSADPQSFCRSAAAPCCCRTWQGGIVRCRPPCSRIEWLPLRSDASGSMPSSLPDEQQNLRP